MKRIVSACLEQTQQFESEESYETFLRGLKRKHTQYRILSKDVSPNGWVTVQLIRDYGHYPIGDYLGK